MPRYSLSAEDKELSPIDLKEKINTLEKDFLSFEANNDLLRASESCRKIISLLEELVCYDSSANVLRKLAFYHEWLGDDDSALEYYWKLYRINENGIEAVKSLCDFVLVRAWNHYMDDHTDEAYDLALRALSIAKNYFNQNGNRGIEETLAYAYKSAANIGININEAVAAEYLQHSLKLYQELESQQQGEKDNRFTEHIADIEQFANNAGIKFA